jgi:hypothetical protein
VQYVAEFLRRKPVDEPTAISGQGA